MKNKRKMDDVQKGYFVLLYSKNKAKGSVALHLAIKKCKLQYPGVHVAGFLLGEKNEKALTRRLVLWFKKGIRQIFFLAVGPIPPELTTHTIPRTVQNLREKYLDVDFHYGPGDLLISSRRSK